MTICLVMGSPHARQFWTPMLQESRGHAESRNLPRQLFRFCTVLCPVDFSKQSLTALYTAAGLAQVSAGRLVVWHAAPRGLKSKATRAGPEVRSGYAPWQRQA